jgi:hypothetical protein
MVLVAMCDKTSMTAFETPTAPEGIPHPRGRRVFLGLRRPTPR